MRSELASQVAIYRLKDFSRETKVFITLPLQFREIKYENRYYFYDVFINIQDENANTREDLYYA